jgi:hypothetical protein
MIARTTVAVVAVLSLMLFAETSPASEERQFTGTLSAGTATDLGREVRLDVTLHVFNFGSADATRARIVVPGTDTPVLAERVDIPARGSEAPTVVHGTLTLQSATYDLWLHGMPIVVLVERNMDGVLVRQLVELTP